ncbi:osmotically inducible protein C [Pontibacillus halophilus JSM 076056 = DSM 19796]|uniref:Osmotically inducible protein C n=1 Tax=Pontibacillus halophilus JSM 076056 = DSM 19796 TaxID=1385510 RepID=A0A0A5GP94_9BACI|nr:OsmC family protein [Pontibacillus halophilus]KGX92980.1 osmotically inducible protein C [Pontibacillus halophilus JSM 076056 = DSM 19796]
MEFYMKDQGVRTSFEFGTLEISGNEEYGFRPFQLMVSSIAGCSVSVFRKILDKQRIDYSDIQVSAEVERNEKEANRIEKINLHYVVKGKNLDPEKLNKNLELSSKNCSMVQSVVNSIEINETLECIEINE